MQNVTRGQPSPPSTDTRSAQTETYVVASGDMLLVIARGFGCTVADLEKLNPDLATNRASLKVGQRLIVPKTRQTPTVPRLPEDSSDSKEYPPPGAFENIVHLVWVEPDQEPIVADLYDRFLTLLAGGPIESGARLPASKRFVTEIGAYAVFGWAYYIAPNEPRGFEIAIPKELLQRKGGEYVVTAELQVNDLDEKQFNKIFVMKRASAATLPPGVNGSIEERKQ